MPNLTLYRTVGNLNRVALGDLAEGVEFYTASKATDGTITLEPVTMSDSTHRAQAATDETETPDTDEAPFS